ncbi:MAG: SUMF1/EgtB/PvdO family nonheme iron enzyme [Magnetococcales bacterium]|nr:SUMF1/EgtB/PvdO family nonheme iron enzyme [Magnetococcales bacterium]
MRTLMQLLVLCLILTPWPEAMANPKQVALVIGNGDYRHATRLPNAANDAQAVQQALLEKGFSVIFRKNASRAEMNDAIDEFIGKLSSDSIALFYYIGHGVQVRNNNYLIPVELQAEKENHIIHNSIEMTRLVDQLSEVQAKFSLVILDACRENPFRRNGRALGGEQGLAPPINSADGIMMVYSAGVNQSSREPTGSGNGLFTHEFVQALQEPGASAKGVVENVKQRILVKTRASGSLQTPTIYDQSSGTFQFSLPADGKMTVTLEPPAPTVNRETLFWQSAQASGDPAQMQAYLQKYPKGSHVQEAHARIRELSARPAPAPAAAPAPVGTVAVTWNDFVRVPGGTITLACDPVNCRKAGTSPGVTVESFEIGKYEVTQGQWQEVMGSNPSRFASCGESCPVEQVSWQEVQAFLTRLNASGRGRFRLPTEAEWTFACRSGGGDEGFCGGSDPDALGWHQGNARNGPRPVGQKSANRLGIHDMTGNVAEWTCSEHGKFDDGWNVHSRCSDKETQKVTRGGSWADDRSHLLASSRGIGDPHTKNFMLGLRLVRER